MERSIWNTDPEFITNFYENVVDFLSIYGWYLLVALCGLLYLLFKIQPFVEKYLKRKADKEYDFIYHKNPDLFLTRLSAMEENRKKMQEKQDQLAEAYRAKVQQREEQKRREWLSKQIGTNTCGTKLGTKQKDDKSSKSDFFPLMGDSSGNGQRYRAPKRSPCGGGGCGKRD